MEFQAGDKALLKLKPHMWKQISSEKVHRGLIPRFDGTFTVVKRVGQVDYKMA